MSTIFGFTITQLSIGLDNYGKLCYNGCIMVIKEQEVQVFKCVRVGCGKEFEVGSRKQVKCPKCKGQHAVRIK